MKLGELLSRARHALFSRLLRKRSAKVGFAIILAFILMMIIGPFFVQSPTATSSLQHSPPSYSHPFGTDWLGHDVLSEVVWGAFPSLSVSIAAATGAVVLGLLVGVFAGYFSKLEGLLTGTADVVLTFPALPLLVLLGSLFPVTNVLIASILILVLWPPVARSIRSQVLSVKQMPYIEAAKTSGMKNRQIILRAIIPEVIPLAIAYFVLLVAAAVVLVSALEFLGVGNPNIVSWGSMLYYAQIFAFYNGDWWWILAPGLSITLVATGFALLGFSVEEVMNPRLRV